MSNFFDSIKQRRYVPLLAEAIISAAILDLAPPSPYFPLAAYTSKKPISILAFRLDWELI